MTDSHNWRSSLRRRGKVEEVPTSIEAERATLSAALLSPDGLADVMEVLGADASMFFDKKCGASDAACLITM